MVLEDNENRIKRFKQELIGHELDVYVDADPAVQALKTKNYDVVFLDHDLDNETYVDPLERNTGYEVIRFLVRNKLNTNTNFIVHSMNPVEDSMVKSLKANDYKAVRAVFNSHEFYSIIEQLSNYKDKET